MTLGEVRNGLGDPPVGSRWVGGHSGRPGTGRGGPRRIEVPSGRARTGQETLREVWDAPGDPRGGRDGSGDPPAGPEWNGRPAGRSGTEWETLGEDWDSSRDPQRGSGWVGGLGVRDLINYGD